MPLVIRIFGLFLACLSLFSIADDSTSSDGSQTQEFCLEGEFDLGLRQQGYDLNSGEFYPMSWCVTYETKGARVQFASKGNINADAADEFTLRYLDNNSLQIMDGNSQPVVAFVGAIISAEGAAHRRIDPSWLYQELHQNPEYVTSASKNKFVLRYAGLGYPVSVITKDEKVVKVVTKADFPLRGTAEVVWNWDWSDSAEEPSLTMTLAGETLFKAKSTRRILLPARAEAFWGTSNATDIREIPGKAWPSRMSMSIEPIGLDVYTVNGVRTGFHHLVVNTKQGLVVVDAPAGWIEIQQIPPADLVPGLGVSGLSEQFVDFLKRQFPDIPIHAVLLTHSHDDHAGGARAFAAEGAEVYAPAMSVNHLNKVFNSEKMPIDRLGPKNKVSVKPLTAATVLGKGHQRIEIKPLTGNPHSKDGVAVWLPREKLLFVSDIKMPHGPEKETDLEQRGRYCWFANWAATQLPETYEILNSHSHHRLSAEVLREFAVTNQCGE